MNRSIVTTGAATAGLIAAAALFLAAPALAESVSRASGEVTRYPGQSPASDVPEGASARVQSVATSDGRTIVTLKVSGFEAFAQYGAHAHTSPCGDPATNPTGTAAGPHFQHVVDPVKPSVDPAFANPQNEIWLDVATNRAGEGQAKAVVDWQFTPERRAQSVIIHERQTSTQPGEHGTAGKRVACLDVPF
jgi:Cu-Zn family superoxide dismutase